MQRTRPWVIGPDPVAETICSWQLPEATKEQGPFEEESGSHAL